MNELELRIKLINELSECIKMLSDEEYPCSSDYIINRYLWDICINEDKYKAKGV